MFFNDIDHIVTTFGSEYVRTKVGPDAPFFADFETAMVLLAYEKTLSLKTDLALAHQDKVHGNDGTTAMYFLSTLDNQREGDDLEPEFSAVLIEELERHASQEATAVIASISVLSEKMDLNAYFGGREMPQFAVVYKIHMKSASSAAAIRKAQLAFEKRLEGKVDASESFIVFGKEALVLDATKDVRVSCFPDKSYTHRC